MDPRENRLKKSREDHGLTQGEVAAKIRKLALARGDAVEPGLSQDALSKHENGHKRPGPYYRALYSELYGVTPVELGFCLALPGENGHPDDVDRREFLAGAAGFVAEATFAGFPELNRRLSAASRADR